MDPTALFAPGGIVQGLSNLGNSIGDSFKSYALIRKQRDEADMARTKMLFDAQDRMKQHDLEQQRIDAQLKFQAGQQAMEQQRIGLEGRRVTAEEQGQIQAQAERERARQFQSASFAAEHGAYNPQAPLARDPMLADISANAQRQQELTQARQGISPKELFAPLGGEVLTNPDAMFNPKMTQAGQAYQDYQTKEKQGQRLTEAEIAAKEAMADKSGSAALTSMLNQHHLEAKDLDAQIDHLTRTMPNLTPERQDAAGLELAKLKQRQATLLAEGSAIKAQLMAKTGVAVPETKKPDIWKGNKPAVPGGAGAGDKAPKEAFDFDKMLERRAAENERKIQNFKPFIRPDMQ